MNTHFLARTIHSNVWRPSDQNIERGERIAHGWQQLANDDTWVLCHSALHDAVAAGSLERTQSALAEGADPNGRTVGALTPLHVIAMKYSRKATAGAPAIHLARLDAITCALIAAGADATLRDGKGMLPMAWADGHPPPSLRAETARLAAVGTWHGEPDGRSGVPIFFMAPRHRREAIS